MSTQSRRINPNVPTNVPFPIADGREFRALATIEAVERLAFRAIHALDDENMSKETAVDHVHVLLAAIVDLTTSRTATEVKNQKDSDDISADAAKTIARVIAELAPDEHVTIAESYSRLAGKYEPQ